MSTVSDTLYPRYRPVAERAMLVEFDHTIAADIHGEVVKVDSALSAAPFEGFIEAIPAYASLLVCFDPLLTDHLKVRSALTDLITGTGRPTVQGRVREIEFAMTPTLRPTWPRSLGNAG